MTKELTKRVDRAVAAFGLALEVISSANEWDDAYDYLKDEICNQHTKYVGDEYAGCEICDEPKVYATNWCRTHLHGDWRSK
jgi:hypothetical protein